MSLRNPPKVFVEDESPTAIQNEGVEIIPVIQKQELEDKLRRQESKTIWAYLFWLSYSLIVAALIFCITSSYNTANACDNFMYEKMQEAAKEARKETNIKLFAEYHHNSSIPGGKPFHNGEDELVTNVYSFILSVPVNRHLLLEFGTGLDYHSQYGKEPTGTFRVRVPLWQN